MNNKNQHLTQDKFTDYALPAPLQAGINELGYEFCTPIQAKSLPVILNNQNIIGQASTGTGKTATFLIAVINRLLTQTSHSKDATKLRALILAPTRELAIQINEEANALIRHCKLSTTLIYGGANYEKQQKSLRQGCDILIGTVGRVIDFYKQGLVNLKTVETLVLDEADRMLDMGFIKDVRYILHKLPRPENRLNLLFSATINFKVKEFAYELMNDPEIISAEQEAGDVNIEQRAYSVANSEKIPLLVSLLRSPDLSRAIVFANMKVTAEKITAFLQANDVSAQLISGDVPQKKRQKLVKDFGEGKFLALVATDVAARGLHIDAVSHVFNYDLPQDPEDYVHRIGRTGRIGSTGHAISFICESYAFYLPDIEDFVGYKIPMESVSSHMLAEIKPRAARKRTRNSTHQKQKKSSRHKHQRRKAKSQRSVQE
ncbi:MAG TPA: DEAD/DEAH box helicase [Gammaproteobacteria bacterium]|nr:DEAD/DEAH box helicase [Gammaproteobacteria bacterium]